MLGAVLQYLPLPLLVLVTTAFAIIAALANKQRLQAAFPFLRRPLETIQSVRGPLLRGLFTLAVLGIAGLAYGWQSALIPNPFLALEGRLLRRDGRPAAGIRLLFFRGNSHVAETFAITDQSGYFSISGLYRDRYDIRAMELREDRGELLETAFGRDMRAGHGYRVEEFPLQVSQLSRVGTIYFDTAKSELDSTATKELRRLLGSIPSHAMETLWFGFADERGSEAANLRLGADRVNEALEATVERGELTMPIENRVVASFGKALPAVPGDGAQALTRNRRVEVYAVSVSLSLESTATAGTASDRR